MGGLYFQKNAAWDLENSPHDTSPHTEICTYTLSSNKSQLKTQSTILNLLKMLGKTQQYHMAYGGLNGDLQRYKVTP